MRKLLAIAFALLFSSSLQSQSQAIFLDGRTDDWSQLSPTYIDSQNEGGTYDFIYFSATNDENFLYLKMKVTPFLKLLENNLISVYIDGDNNSSTGFQINGIGAELRFGFGYRNGFNYYTNSTATHSSLKFRSLPTVTDTVFEMAIGRQQIPPAGSGTIRIFFADNSSSGDRMPDNGLTFSYTFDNTPTAPLTPVEINREDTTLLRVMNWNTLEDGLTDPSREQSYRRILQAVRPDIIGFNEVWDATATEIQNKLNSMIPIQNGSWNTIKLDAGNVIASRYPVLQSWIVYSGQRITASLIDVPDRFGKDFLVINCHYKCCGGASNDATRQREADATIAFLLDAKSPGGVITLPQNTPYVIMGDLNLVGERQQLKTLLTGEIINTQLFGNGAKPDWDNTDLEDLISMQSDKRTAYTWRDDPGSYPPSRLDFQIYSNSAVNVEKSFVIQTEIMSQARLNLYGFLQNDTKTASDHFPKVSDISFRKSVNVQNNVSELSFELEQNYPNPFNPSTMLKYHLPINALVSLKIFDVLGREVAELVNAKQNAGRYEISFDANNLSGGIYFYKLQAGESVQIKKMVLMR
ncbi:MAG: endonuclease/exonuclease/phosphatase family protein [Ignavibacteria bacterium]|nr:endonuclease/exonuclease/phosphatase family protein [Ignavibacteria bacterium]